MIYMHRRNLNLNLSADWKQEFNQLTNTVLFMFFKTHRIDTLNIIYLL